MVRPDDFPPVHAKDHFRILLKQKWTAILFLALLVGMTALYLALTEPRYAAKVKLVIKPPPISPLTMMSEILYSEGVDIVARRTFVTTQFEVLKSRRLAERVMDRLDLWKEYRLGEEKRSLFGPARVLSRDGAASDFAEAVLVASPNIMSNHIELQFEHRDPDQAARIANALVENYLEILYEDRSNRIQENLRWLQAEFNRLEQEVVESDQAMQDFKKKRNLISVDDRENILLQKLHALNTSVIQARIARIASENTYLDARQLEAEPTQLERAPMVLATNPQIAALHGQLNLLRTEHARMQERYQEKHPKMIELGSTLQELENRVRAEVLKALESLKINLDLAKSQEDSLLRELEAVQKEVIEMDEQRIDYLQLFNASKVNRTVYDSLLSRLKETVILQTFQNPNETIQVIDRAVPPQKPAGFRVYFLPVACGVGILVGLFLCYVRDYFDTTVENDRDIHETLRLPQLEVLPRFKKSRKEGGRGFDQAALLHPEAPYVDHLRRLAHRVVHLADKKNLRTLLVTSAGPREGRTSVVSNLGIVFAQRNQRVLLVDGDLRRPRLHEIFSVENRAGLRDLLRSNQDPGSLVQKTEMENLFLLPAGPSPAADSQALESARISVILEELKGSYDRILIDSPALLEVADSTALALRTDAILWIIASGQTTREKAFWALQSLALLDREILGVVLNKVRFIRGSTGYYSTKR